ncbi:MAG: hypothetical protein H6564_06740 [Lewinellaceae bacterium]|nr:hypothetical protein [Lewinellaceae bacterium]
MANIFDLERELSRQQQLFGGTSSNGAYWQDRASTSQAHSYSGAKELLDEQPYLIIDKIVGFLAEKQTKAGDTDIEDILALAGTNQGLREKALTSLLAYSSQILRERINQVKEEQKTAPSSGHYRGLSDVWLQHDLDWAEQVRYDVLRVAPGFEPLEMKTLLDMIAIGKALIEE